MNKLAIQFIICILAVVFFTNEAKCQSPTAKQKRQVRSISKTLDKAERLLASGKLKSSAEKVDIAQTQILNIAATANSKLMKLLQSEFKRLSTTHESLKKQDVEIDPLTPLPEPMPGNAPTVSFVTQVAPIIVKNCGRCHVNRSRGEFSAKSYGSIMLSLHVSPGRPDTSRLVELISDGSMPPDGQVAANDLNTIKIWIRQGAKFDGDDPAGNLNLLTGKGNNERVRLQPTAPKGNESVSFARDVAPILVKSCSGCHINARRLSGNFDMNSFARMLRGGDSGNPFVPGSPDESTIVKRLRGIDSEIMPPKKKLGKKKIAIIAKWISEGASFDGNLPDLDVETVASIAKAAAQTHQQLAVERDKLGNKNWQLIMSDDEPDVFRDEHFRILGSGYSSRLEDTARLANQLRMEIVEELHSETDRPFVKGKTTIYLFERRYDLNELGMMLDGTGFPKNQTGHWNYTTIDAYASIILSRGKSPEKIETQLAQQLAALHVAALAADVPRWFADGVGYLTASRIFRKDDKVKEWSASASEITAGMDQAFGFATGKLNKMDSGLGGYTFVMELRHSGQLTKLMKLLRSGYTFENAFASIFGSKPDNFFNPKKSKSKR